MIKVLYAGSPEASAGTLRILFEREGECGYKIAGVLTNPPKSRGRHKEKLSTPVADAAREHGIPVIEAEHLDAAAREKAMATGADILVSFAYGRIFGPKFLALFKCGALNFHPSPLPKYRGPSPIPATILNGEKKTSFCVQLISLKMDEGEIVAKEDYELAENESSFTLLSIAAKSGGKLLGDTLKTLSETGRLPPSCPQSGEATYTKLIKTEDAKIDWNKSAEEIERALRAYFDTPKAWTTKRGEVLKILSGRVAHEDECKGNVGAKAGEVVGGDRRRGIFIKCGNGVFCALTLQKSGKKPLSFKDFLNGERNLEGEILGT